MKDQRRIGRLVRVWISKVSNNYLFFLLYPQQLTHGSVSCCKQHESMDPSCVFFNDSCWWFGQWLEPIKHCLIATAYLCSISEDVLPFISSVSILLIATSGRIMHHVTKLLSSQTVTNQTRTKEQHQSSIKHRLIVRVVQVGRARPAGKWGLGKFIHRRCQGQKAVGFTGEQAG